MKQQHFYLATIVLIVAFLLLEALTRDKPRVRRYLLGGAVALLVLEVIRRMTSKPNPTPKPSAPKEIQHEPDTKTFQNPTTQDAREVEGEHDDIDILRDNELDVLLEQYNKRADEDSEL